jgi:excisionase family DNA binding protein
MAGKDDVFRLFAAEVLPFVIGEIKVAYSTDGPARVEIDVRLTVCQMRGPMLTTDEVAQHLKASTSSVDRWRDGGDLACIRLGTSVRYDPGDVDDFVSRHRDAPSDSPPGSTS